MVTTRREFVGGLAALSANVSLAAQIKSAMQTCSFHVGVINDEISPDFDHACSVAANDFGLGWIELRSMWGTNVTELSDAQVAESRKILAKYKLKVSDIASPLYKTDFPGAPVSKHSPQRDKFSADVAFKKQDELLERCAALAKEFGTDKIRCFDFWRLENQAPYRAEINRILKEGAEKLAKHDLMLVIENEPACNTATGEEALAVLNAIPNQNFELNWDPGNAATFQGDMPFPDDYEKLPKHRIAHCHVKSAVRPEGKKAEWAPVGQGLVNWVEQFKALQRDGYRETVSLETHWHGGGTPEQSTRISMAGLKDSLLKAGLDCRR